MLYKKNLDCFKSYLQKKFTVNVLTLNNISKNYGNIRALNNISFSVPQGSVFGILGPNGSGKTTMLGIIMDILRPTSGSFTFFDQAPFAAMRRQVGTLLETPNFYHYLSGERNLRIAAEIKQKGIDEIDAALEKVDLYKRKNYKFSTYSLGMKQRLAIASCLLGSPSVLVFDEPTNGLDPVGIAEIRTLITKLSGEGKTIIMASHLLDEVEKVCTHVAILKTGNLLASGLVDEVLVNEDIVELGSANIEQLDKILQTLNGYSSVKKNGYFIQLFYARGAANLEEINRFCFNNGVTLNHLQLKRKSLETKFLELTNN